MSHRPRRPVRKGTAAEYQIKRVADLHARIRKCGARNTIFRGESASYPLKPKLGRYAGDRLKRAIEAETEILEDFKRMARPFLRESAPIDDWEWLALAQHHGLATRLLDWTENPLVAAFFAVHDKLEGDAVIYALDEKCFKEPPRGSSPFTITEPYVYRPQHITPRITSQAGVLLAHHDLSQELRCSGMEKWVVHECCLLEIDAQLHQYGIHAANLFPGLGGIAKHVMTSWMAD